MRRVRNAAGVVLCVFIAAAATYAVARRGETVKRRPALDRPSVLLICLDTVRRDHVSSYGYSRKTTPNVDALAADGMIFDRCVSVSNWTLPAHASMFTGLFQTTHGAHYLPGDQRVAMPGHPSFSPAGRLHDNAPTLAETLSNAGYDTAAVVANIQLQRAYGLDRGFAYYDDRCGCSACRAKTPGEAQPSLPYRSATEIADEAIRWLDKDRKEPFFLFLNFMDAHAPYFPPAPFDGQFRDELSRRWEQRFSGKRSWPMEHAWWEQISYRVNRDRTEPAPEAAAWMQCQYDGGIAYADQQIGRILDWLRDTGWYDNTLVFITSDHGEAFGEHRVMSHSIALYEPEVAVPMIVKLPRQERAGERVGHWVQLTDILPTSLEVFGMPIPSGTQGKSMLMGRDTGDPFVMQHANVDQSAEFADFDEMQWAVYRGRFKYIEHADGRYELYDLASDPHELDNVADKRQNELTEMRAALNSRREAIQPLGPGKPAENLRPETVEQLRNLGYVQ